ncbi:MAG TPA: hypothetical protein VLJ21_04930, partial [Candidatus Binatia bacterium]|nr:hypothetical protein [Candidatus Binatia bacterium]
EQVSGSVSSGSFIPGGVSTGSGEDAPAMTVCCCKDKIPCAPGETHDKHFPLELDEPNFIFGKLPKAPEGYDVPKKPKSFLGIFFGGEAEKFHPLITEVKNRGEDRFVEISNPSDAAMDLSQYFVVLDDGTTSFLGYFPVFKLDAGATYAIFESDWLQGKAEYLGGGEDQLLPTGTGFATLYAKNAPEEKAPTKENDLSDVETPTKKPTKENGYSDVTGAVTYNIVPTCPAGGGESGGVPGTNLPGETTPGTAPTTSPGTTPGETSPETTAPTTPGETAPSAGTAPSTEPGTAPTSSSGTYGTAPSTGTGGTSEGTTPSSSGTSGGTSAGSPAETTGTSGTPSTTQPTSPGTGTSGSTTTGTGTTGTTSSNTGSTQPTSPGSGGTGTTGSSTTSKSGSGTAQSASPGTTQPTSAGTGTTSTGTTSTSSIISTTTQQTTRGTNTLGKYGITKTAALSLTSATTLPNGVVVDIKPLGAPEAASGQMICDPHEGAEEKKPTPPSAGFHHEDQEPWESTWYIGNPTPNSWCGEEETANKQFTPVHPPTREATIPEMTENDRERTVTRAAAASLLETELPKASGIPEAPDVLDEELELLVLESYRPRVVLTSQGLVSVTGAQILPPGGGPLSGAGAEFLGHVKQKNGPLTPNDVFKNIMGNSRIKDSNEQKAVAFKAKEFNPTYGRAVAEQHACPYYVLREPTEPAKAEADNTMQAAKAHMSELNDFHANELKTLYAALRWSITGVDPLSDAQGLNGAVAEANYHAYQKALSNSQIKALGARKETLKQKIQDSLHQTTQEELDEYKQVNDQLNGLLGGAGLAGQETQQNLGNFLQGQIDSLQDSLNQILESGGQGMNLGSDIAQLKALRDKFKSGKLSHAEFQKLFDQWKQQQVDEAQKLKDKIESTDFAKSASKVHGKVRQLAAEGNALAARANAISADVQAGRPCRVPDSIALMPLAPPIALFVAGRAADLRVTADLADLAALQTDIATTESGARSPAELMKALETYDKYVAGLVIIEKMQYKIIELLDLLEHQMRVEVTNADCCGPCRQPVEGGGGGKEATVTPALREDFKDLPEGVTQDQIASTEVAVAIPEITIDNVITGTETGPYGAAPGGTRDPCDGVSVASDIADRKINNGGQLLEKVGVLASGEKLKEQIDKKLKDASDQLGKDLEACVKDAAKKAVAARDRIFDQFPLPGEGYLTGPDIKTTKEIIDSSGDLAALQNKLRARGMESALGSINAELQACVDAAKAKVAETPGLEADGTGGSLTFKDGKLGYEKGTAGGVKASYLTSADGKEAIVAKPIPPSQIDCVKSKEIQKKHEELTAQTDSLRKQIAETQAQIDEAQKTVAGQTQAQKAPCDDSYQVKYQDGKYVAYKPGTKGCEEAVKKAEAGVGLDGDVLAKQISDLSTGLVVNKEAGTISQNGKELTETQFADLAGTKGVDARKQATELYSKLKQIAPFLKQLSDLKSSCAQASEAERKGVPEQVLTVSANDPCFQRKKLDALNAELKRLNAELGTTLTQRATLFASMPGTTDNAILEETASDIRELGKMAGISETAINNALLTPTATQVLVKTIEQKLSMNLGGLLKPRMQVLTARALRDAENIIAQYEEIQKTRSLSAELDLLAEARITKFMLQEPASSGVQFTRRIKNLYASLAADQGKTDEEINAMLSNLEDTKTVVSKAMLRKTMLDKVGIDPEVQKVLERALGTTADRTERANNYITRYVPKETRDRLAKQGVEIKFDEATQTFIRVGFPKSLTAKTDQQNWEVDRLNLKFAGWHVRKDIALESSTLSPQQKETYETVSAVEKNLETQAILNARGEKTDLWTIQNTDYLDLLDYLDPSFSSQLRVIVDTVVQKEYPQKVAERTFYKGEAAIAARDRKWTQSHEASDLGDEVDREIHILNNIKAWLNPDQFNTLVASYQTETIQAMNDVAEGRKNPNKVTRLIKELEHTQAQKYFRDLRIRLEKEGKTPKEILQTLQSDEVRQKALASGVNKAYATFKLMTKTFELAKKEGLNPTAIHYAASALGGSGGVATLAIASLATTVSGDREKYHRAVAAYDVIVTSYLSTLISPIKNADGSTTPALLEHRPSTVEGQATWLSTWATVATILNDAHTLLKDEYYTLTREGIRVPHYSITKWLKGFSGLFGGNPTEEFDRETQYLQKLASSLNALSTLPGKDWPEKANHLVPEQYFFLKSNGILQSDGTIFMDTRTLNRWDSTSTYQEGYVDGIVNFDHLIDLEIMLASGYFASAGTGALSAFASGGNIALRFSPFSAFLTEGFLFHTTSNLLHAGASSIGSGSFFDEAYKQDWSLKGYGSSYAFLGLGKLGGAFSEELSEAMGSSAISRMTSKTLSAALEAHLFTTLGYVTGGVPDDDIYTHYLNNLIDMAAMKTITKGRESLREKFAEMARPDLEKYVGNLKTAHNTVELGLLNKEIGSETADKLKENIETQLTDALDILAGKQAADKDFKSAATTVKELNTFRKSAAELSNTLLKPSDPFYNIKLARNNHELAGTKFKESPTIENFRELMNARAKLIAEMQNYVKLGTQSGAIPPEAAAWMDAKLKEQVAINHALDIIEQFRTRVLTGKATPEEIKSFDVEKAVENFPEPAKETIKEELVELKTAAEKAGDTTNVAKPPLVEAPSLTKTAPSDIVNTNEYLKYVVTTNGDVYYYDKESGTYSDKPLSNTHDKTGSEILDKVREFAKQHAATQGLPKERLTQLQELFWIPAETAVPDLLEGKSHVTKLIDVIGSGTYGTVFIAEVEGVEGPVAIKVMRPQSRDAATYQTAEGKELGASESRKFAKELVKIAEAQKLGLPTLEDVDIVILQDGNLAYKSKLFSKDYVSVEDLTPEEAAALKDTITKNLNDGINKLLNAPGRYSFAISDIALEGNIRVNRKTGEVLFADVGELVETLEEVKTLEEAKQSSSSSLQEMAEGVEKILKTIEGKAKEHASTGPEPLTLKDLIVAEDESFYVTPKATPEQQTKLHSLESILHAADQAVRDVHFEKVSETYKSGAKELSDLVGKLSDHLTPQEKAYYESLSLLYAAKGKIIDDIFANKDTTPDLFKNIPDLQERLNHAPEIIKFKKFVGRGATKVAILVDVRMPDGSIREKVAKFYYSRGKEYADKAT